MKRRLLLLLLPGLLLWAPVASAAPATSARLTACESSLDQPARTMAVEGRMKTLDGARKLQMRFELQVRLPDRARFTRVAAPGFGAWNTAEPAPRRYVFEKRVEALAAPARYRMLVRFRWLGADDERLASTRRVSPVCAQADLRPDLEVTRIEIGPADRPELRRYTVPVQNTGRSLAGPFGATMTVNGAALTPISVITGLPANGRSELVFEGPPCRPETSVAVQVDPDGAVDERDEADNSHVRDC